MSESVFLSPKSIAVIGASDKQGSVGRAITSNIMNGYKGTVYPISPTRETVFDQKAYKSVLDVPDPIDLAVVITKNTIVPVVLEEPTLAMASLLMRRASHSTKTNLI